MRVAILHYHFKPGGVTRVVEHAVAALRGAPPDARLAAISGEPCSGGALPLTGVVEGLRYANQAERGNPAALERSVRAEAARLLGGPPDLWHIHNHSLGKTPLMAPLVRRLADAGDRLLLQIHDFAEDGRPSNYATVRSAAELSGVGLEHLLYPVGSAVHYAVLNRRDYDFLAAAGFHGEHLHWLPNAVHVTEGSGSIDTPEVAPAWTGGRPRLYLYPTRAIRRKNLGEMLFWAALADEETAFASTLEPANPLEQPAYREWVAFAGEHRLPAYFGVGQREGVSFAELVRASEAILTTSVAEGFGLAFLEPWLLGKGLAGRDLPAITRDFKQDGVELEPFLYPRLEIPLEWIGGEAPLRRAIAGALERSYAAYGETLPESAHESAWTAFVRDGQTDFGRLDASLQRRAIERVIDQGPDAAGRAISPGRPGDRADPTLIERNRAVIAQRYSLSAYGQRLHSLYRKILDASAVPSLESIPASGVLRAFLRPENLFLLRT